MAHIQRIRVNHYVDAAGRRCARDAAGARKVEGRTACYYWFDGRTRVRKLYTDKRASQRALGDYETAKERGEAGMADPFARSRATPTAELADKYLAAVAAQPGNPKYRAETARILRAVLQAVAAAKLGDLTAEGVNGHLTALAAAGKAPNTRKKHHSALSGFCRWLFENGHIRENLILRVPIPRRGGCGPRRSSGP